jgi:CheY-like chemotaxis protein
MPVMDGYEAARRIRTLQRADAKKVPIIAMTADAFADDIQRCLDAGMNAHIAKPIDPELLFDTICRAVDR